MMMTGESRKFGTGARGFALALDRGERRGRGVLKESVNGRPTSAGNPQCIRSAAFPAVTKQGGTEIKKDRLLARICLSSLGWRGEGSWPASSFKHVSCVSFAQNW